MSAIPPIEPALPSHNTRAVHRRTPEDDQDPPHGFEQPKDEQSDEPEQHDDDGLPHVDIRV